MVWQSFVCLCTLLQVWAIDLDLTYSNQLAMTQVILSITGGTLNCRTCRLEVPVPVKEKSSLHQKGAKQHTVGVSFVDIFLTADTIQKL